MKKTQKPMTITAKAWNVIDLEKNPSAAVAARRIDCDMIITRDTRRRNALWHIETERGDERFTERGFHDAAEAMAHAEAIWPHGYKRVVSYVPETIPAAAVRALLEVLTSDGADYGVVSSVAFGSGRNLKAWRTSGPAKATFAITID